MTPQDGAHIKGRIARLAHEPFSACPYRNGRGWAHSFRAAWERGWREANREQRIASDKDRPGIESRNLDKQPTTV